METLLAQIFSFLAVFALILAIPSMFAKTPALASDSRRIPGIFKSFLNEFGFVGSILGNSGSKANRAIEADLRLASFALEARHLRGAQVVLCLICGSLGGALIYALLFNLRYALFAGLLGCFLGWIFPRTWLRSKAQQRQDEISRSLPYSIDLLTVAMTAGQDFSAALRHVVNEGLKGPLAEEFALVLREIELGKTRENALRMMEHRIQLKQFSALVGNVIQGSEMGSSIAKTLRIQGEEIRRERFHRAERQAARAPSLMLLPMAVFILPAVFIIIFTPVVLRVMSSGMGSFFGQ